MEILFTNYCGFFMGVNCERKNNEVGWISFELVIPNKIRDDLWGAFQQNFSKGDAWRWANDVMPRSGLM